MSGKNDAFSIKQGAFFDHYFNISSSCLGPTQGAVELPVNKNLMKTGSQMQILEGVVVYAPDTGRVYLPVQAVYLIRGSSEPLPGIGKND